MLRSPRTNPANKGAIDMTQEHVTQELKAVVSMNTLTQQFLESNALEELTTRYAIKVKRHGEFPNLVMLKYDQINSPMSEPIVQECRGIILDEADNWRVVSFPFRKFFN